MNQIQAQTALALGLKIRKTWWSKLKFIHSVNGVLKSDTGVRIKLDTLRHACNDWEIYHEPEASHGNDEPGFESN